MSEMQIVSGEALEPGGDIHPIAKHIPIPLDDVLRVNANPYMNLFGLLFLSVVGTELCLHLLGTLDGMDDRREIHQEGITDGFDDVAVMGTHRVLNNPIVNFQQAQHPPFIGTHLPTEADDVGEHDRRKFAVHTDRRCLLVGHHFSFQSLDYSVGNSGLSTVRLTGHAWVYASLILFPLIFPLQPIALLRILHFPALAFLALRS
jgi:hypothetical protein